MDAGIGERLDGLRRNLHAVTLADVFDARALGFALSLAWSSIVLFSTVVHFSTRNDVSHFNSVMGFSSLGLLAVLVAAACAPQVFQRAMSRAAVRWATPVGMAICTVVLVIVDFDVVRQPYCSIASSVAGAGLGVLYLTWGAEFSKLEATQAAVKAASSFLLAAGLFALVVALPRPYAVGATIAIALGIGVVMRAAGAWQGEEEACVPRLRRGAFLIRALLSLGVLSFSESFMRALFLNAMPIISEGSYPWLFLVATILSIALVCTPLLSGRVPDFALAYQVAVFSLGFLFLLLPILELGSVVSDVSALTTYGIVTLLVWIVLVRLTRMYHLAPLFVFGVGWGAYVTGTLGGTFGGALLMSFVDLGPRELSLVALVCVCLLFCGYLFLFSERAMARMLGGEAADGRHPFRAKCALVASQFELTEREEEVMVLVAKGRSTPRIQKALGLTAGTVNSHLSHLYRKLDVHDKQELIDLIEDEHPADQPVSSS